MIGVVVSTERIAATAFLTSWPQAVAVIVKSLVLCQFWGATPYSVQPSGSLPRPQDVG